MYSNYDIFIMTMYHLPDEAVREAKADCDKLKERAEEEESLVTLDELEQIHAEADEMVVSDRQELTANRDRIRVMESVPGAETILLNTASEVETIFVISVTNCQELRGLQEDTSQWRGKLDTLWQQAEAALLIVETIGGMLGVCVYMFVVCVCVVHLCRRRCKLLFKVPTPPRFCWL